MPVNTSAIGKTYDPVAYAVGREKIREYARAVGETDPLYLDVEAARAAGHADLVAPPMFAVVYSAPAVGPPIFDPEIELNFAMMVHGAQEFEWGVPVIAGDEITTTALGQGHLRSGRSRLLRVRVGLDEPARRGGLPRHVDQHRPRSVSGCPSFRLDESIPELHDHPRQVPDGALRGRLGRLQPDPHRRGVRARGRPARADPARALDDGAGRARADRGGRRTRAPQAAVGAVPRHGRARAGDRGQRHGARGRRRSGDHRHGRRAGRQADHPQRRGRARRSERLRAGWAVSAPPTIRSMLTPRQERILGKVVEELPAHRAAGRVAHRRRRPGARLRALDGPQRTGAARGARPARAPARLGGARADRRRPPLRRRSPAQLRAQRCPRRRGDST